MLIIPALGRLRQEDQEFEGSLGYRARSCHKNIEAGAWLSDSTLA
jgi:hypothetical protein